VFNRDPLDARIEYSMAGFVGSIYIGLVDTSDEASHIHIHTKSLDTSKHREWVKYVTSCNHSIQLSDSPISKKLKSTAGTEASSTVSAVALMNLHQSATLVRRLTSCHCCCCWYWYIEK
jgi:hypothetical protein